MEAKPQALLVECLKEYTGAKYCSLTGSGTAALFASLIALDLPKNAEVVLPSICCYAVPFAVTFSGLKPVFCDVNAWDYNIDLDSVRALTTPRTKVIIMVHLFGQPADAEAICAWAKDRGIYVIDDAAQSFGGSYQDRKLGTFGDVGITSFGIEKIIDVGGGGAVFTNNPELAQRTEKIVARLATYSPRVVRRYKRAYSQFFRILRRLNNNHSRLYRLIPVLSTFIRPMYLYQITQGWAVAIVERLDGMEEIIAGRRKKARLYRHFLQSSIITHPRYDRDAGIPWMYSFCLKAGYRDAVVRTLRRKGILLDTLYSPALHQVYSQRQKLPVAEVVASQIVNLRLDGRFSEERVEQIAAEVTNTCEFVMNTGGETEDDQKDDE
jgi:dTDP-4-amino-4,6-dideoxygalactose transaminase